MKKQVLKELSTEQHIRMNCLALANDLCCSSGQCEHISMQVADEYYNYVMNGVIAKHDEGMEFHGQTFQA